MDIFSVLVRGLIDTADKIKPTYKQDAAPAPALPRSRAEPSLALVQQYMAPLENGPLDTVAIGEAVGVKNPRTTLRNLKKHGYVREILNSGLRGPHSRKLWQATGKHLLE